MNRKEKIYSYICSPEYVSLTFDELKLVLDVPPENTGELKSILDELIHEGRIFVSKKGRYAPAAKNKMFSGIFRCSTSGDFGFVTCDGDEADIHISARGIHTAIDGDRVLVKLTSGKRDRREGIIAEVLERTNSSVSAVMTDEFTAKPDNRRIPFKIKLTGTLNAVTGDRVIAEITDYSKNGCLWGEVTAVLGNSRGIKTLTDAILFENNIPVNFSAEVLDEARTVPSEIDISDFPERENFTNEQVFTIDGDDARDFDDAVSLNILPNGNFELGVHIADVTHYVTAGSPLDAEALLRGTSVYLPGRVIPMLPFELSNGICSLNPGVNRLTLSVIMEIDRNGEVKNHRITEGIIRSAHRMTYADTAEILDGNKKLCEKYSDIVPILKNMYSLASLLKKRRVKRGSINFDFPESKIILRKDGMPESIEKDVRNDAHKIIEEFMLIANETVAEFAFWADLPFIYRVHEEPSAEKTESFRRFIGYFRLYIKGKEVFPKDLQAILEEVSGTENETIIASYMLRSLMKAEYKPECTGHFGLAAKYYCHFTSPIRRYPDLMIHRILKDYISGRDVSMYRKSVSEAAAQSSERERAAELCERSADDLYKAAYISSFIGADFPAKVSGITAFGMFAELENSVEGMIHLETIRGDYYEFDSSQNTLIGKRHGKTYRIGDSIQIEVVGADMISRRIDFVLKGSKPLKPHTKKHKRGYKNG